MRGLRKYVGRRIVVSAEGIDVRGRLEAVFGGVVVIAGAQAIEEPLGVVPVDGDLLVPVARIKYVQAL